MAKYYFKQSVGFGKHNFPKEDNFAGVRFFNKKHQEVSAKIEAHPQFKKLVEIGLVIPSEKMASHGKSESVDERNQRLAKKLSEPKAIPDAFESEGKSEDSKEELPEGVEEKPAKKKGKK